MLQLLIGLSLSEVRALLSALVRLVLAIGHSCEVRTIQVQESSKNKN